MNKTKNLSDLDLIVKYQKGDLRALNHLVEKWHLKFCKLAFWIVKDTSVAKDIAQESWTIIISKLSSLQEPEKFKSWATRILHRKAIDYFRLTNKEKNKLRKHYNETSKTVYFSESNNDENIKKELLQSIAKLSVHHQMVIQLFYKENYNLKEISEMLKISLGTTKSRLFHAREKLKTILKHRNYER